MAHQIYTNEAGKSSVFVVKEPAWHRLGKVLDNPATAEEAILEAGLDFEVEIRPNYVQLADGGFKQSKSFSTVRKDTEAILGSRIGKRYTILQNRDAFKFFDSVVSRDEAVYHSAGVLGNGERIWIMAKLPDHISIKGVDNMDVYVTMFTTHDGTGVASSFIHVDRIVCNNTLQAAISSALKTIRYRHTAGIIDQVTSGADLLGIHNKLKDELAEAFDYMVGIKTNKQIVGDYLQRLFPVPPTADGQPSSTRVSPAIQYRADVLECLESAAGQDMVTTEGTGFGLYNAVTYYIDHVKKYGKGDDAQLKSTWFGSAGELRQRAFELVMAL